MVEYGDGGVSVAAARDRAVAAVVHAYGRGAIDDGACAGMLDDLRDADDAQSLDAVVERLTRLLKPSRSGGEAVSSMGGRRDALVAEAAEAAEVGQAGQPSEAGDRAGVGVGRPVVPATAERRGAGGTAPALRRLDAVDLALAARANAASSRRRDPRLVSLAVVVAVLVVLIVLGLVLLSAVRSHLAGTSGLPQRQPDGLVAYAAGG